MTENDDDAGKLIYRCDEQVSIMEEIDYYAWIVPIADRLGVKPLEEQPDRESTGDLVFQTGGKTYSFSQLFHELMDRMDKITAEREADNG